VAVGGGSAEEFTEFMTGRWHALVRFGYGLTGDVGLAEDLTQTALARAYAAWPKVRLAADPDAYVRRIMVNSNRSRFRAPRVSEHLTGSPPDFAIAGQFSADEDATALRAALLALPIGQRAVVVLRYWLDLSEAETAAALGCSVGNVKSQAARALAKLRVSAELVNGVCRADR